MKPAIKKLWLKALRSGNYRKTCGALARGDKNPEFCCLGVLADVAIDDLDWVRVPDSNVWTLGGISCSGLLPGSALKATGLTYSQQRKLSYRNDIMGCSFREIAEWIEKHL